MDSVADAPLGATVRADGRVCFRLWAPDAASVTAEVEGGDEWPLARDAEGMFSAVVDCPVGARYRYRIDGGEALPDPASRWQPAGVHGASVVVDTGAHAWRHPDWCGRPWRDAVIYELHVGTCGGYAGVMDQLPALAAMGITTIELMPLNSFAGTRNWGYDGVLPYAPAPAYGTPDELKALVDAAHGLGLMVLLDVVYNHFGPDGNHLGKYASAFFRDDLSSPWGQAIDFRREPVRRYFIDNALMWLHEYRFDGLRLDAVHAIEPGEFLDALRERIQSSVAPGRHVHLVLENERNQASLLADGYTAQWNDDFHNALHVLATGETEGYYAMFADDPAGQLARVLGEGFAFQGEPDHHGKPRGEPSAMLPLTKFVVFAQNHDQIGNRACGERLRSLVSDDTLRAALALTALTPMVPLFFMGEPWGSRAPFLFFTDFEAPLDAQVREGRRREFAHFAAFADEARRESIPDPNAEATFRASVADSAEAATGEGAEWVAWFTRLTAMRRDYLVPHLDGARSTGAVVIGPSAVCASWSLGGGRWRVSANFGTQPVALPPLPGAHEVMACNRGDDHAALPPAAFLAEFVPA